MLEVLAGGVHVIGEERAAIADVVRARRQDEVVDGELGASIEQVGERALSLGRVEDVILLDFDPWQRTARCGHAIAMARQFPLLREQFLAGCEPFPARHDRMWLHDYL